MRTFSRTHVLLLATCVSACVHSPRVSSPAGPVGRVPGAVRVLAPGRFDTTAIDTVVPGVIHRRLVDNSGPWHINVLEVDLRQPGLRIEGARANDSFYSRETVSSMARRGSNDSITVVAAVNADFFNLKNGSSENNLVIDGELWKGLKATDSPYDIFANTHSQFAMDGNGKPMIERFALDGAVIMIGNRKPIPLDAMNSRPDSNALVLYTARYDSVTPRDSAGRHPIEVRLRAIGARGDTLIFRVAGRPDSGGWTSLSGGGVLSAGGRSRTAIRRIGMPGAIVRVVARLAPGTTRLRTVLGGWPRLVAHGESIADSVDAIEGTFPKFSGVQHPRTAIGFSRDSTVLFLITVDGRQESSSGMSLVQLARLMLDVGAYEGMNFDGGGSTTMVIRGKVVNSPSDKEGERAVGSALLVEAVNRR